MFDFVYSLCTSWKLPLHVVRLTKLPEVKSNEFLYNHWHPRSIDKTPTSFGHVLNHRIMLKKECQTLSWPESSHQECSNDNITPTEHNNLT